MLNHDNPFMKELLHNKIWYPFRTNRGRRDRGRIRYEKFAKYTGAQANEHSLFFQVGWGRRREERDVEKTKRTKAGKQRSKTRAARKARADIRRRRRRGNNYARERIWKEIIHDIKQIKYRWCKKHDAAKMTCVKSARRSCEKLQVPKTFTSIRGVLRLNDASSSIKWL